MVWVLLVMGLTLADGKAVLAGPVIPIDVILTQPNGVSFAADWFGDEWYSGYEYQSYTILQDATTGYWYYARPTSQGELELTNRRVAIDALPNKLLEVIARDLEALPQPG